MRTHCIALAAAGLALSALAAPAQRITVLTYNIQIGTGMDKKIDLERTARVIRAVAPDLVALQEVDRGARRSGGADQAAELARLTGMHMVFGKASVREGIDHQGGQYGNAILSRFPIEQWSNHALPYTRGYELRSAVHATVKWQRPLRFFATHFDHQNENDRIASAKLLNQLAAGGDSPAILAGDFNTGIESTTLQALCTEWTPAAGQQRLLTFPADTPNRQLDHILFRPAGQWKVIEVRVIDEPMASDHRPVLAILEYTAPRK